MLLSITGTAVKFQISGCAPVTVSLRWAPAGAGAGASPRGGPCMKCLVSQMVTQHPGGVKEIMGLESSNKNSAQSSAMARFTVTVSQLEVHRDWPGAALRLRTLRLGLSGSVTREPKLT